MSMYLIEIRRLQFQMFKIIYEPQNIHAAYQISSKAFKMTGEINLLRKLRYQ